MEYNITVAPESSLLENEIRQTIQRIQFHHYPLDFDYNQENEPLKESVDAQLLDPAGVPSSAGNLSTNSAGHLAVLTHFAGHLAV